MKRLTSHLGYLVVPLALGIYAALAGCVVEDETALDDTGDSVPFNATCDPARAIGAVTPHERALLDTIAVYEGTYNRGYGGGGYNVYFTGPLFGDCTQHPDTLHCYGNLCSDAAGRYQFLYTTWSSWGAANFKPENQDRVAMRLVREKQFRSVPADRAMTYNEFLSALGSCTGGLSAEWASFPNRYGNHCYSDQGAHGIADVWETYQGFVSAAGGGGGGNNPDYFVLVGDWNGDGVKTPGLYDTRDFHWRLSNYNQSTGVQYDFGWGSAGFLPVVGDWDGNGTDTPGLYSLTTYRWHLSNHNSAGGVDAEFGWGGPGWLPIVGDWDGDGDDTIGLFNPVTHEWALSNHNSAGGVDHFFGWGGAGWNKVVGDWDGNGTVTPGLYNPVTHEWRMLNWNAGGGWHITFGWGGGASLPIVGDWNEDGRDTPGTFEPANHTWAMTNYNQASGWAHRFGWGGPGSYAIVGTFALRGD